VGASRLRLMLDTHALIWALEGGSKLSKPARRAIEDASNEVFVSATSAWEIAIKSAMGRLEVPRDLTRAVLSAGFTPRPLGFAEAERLRKLPDHHRDPFDRMLVAHALEERCSLVTKDPFIALYAVEILW
jgi:PIN domain nuclease of toxin-antitoxin system